MTTPLAFAARLLERRGALVEATGGRAEVLLAPPLAADFGLDEHVVLAETPAPAAHHVGYGSHLLERLVATATREVPFVSGRASTTAARASQARAAAEALVFRNGVFAVGDVVGEVGHRLVVHAAYTLYGDEHREGLCAGTASLLNSGVVEGFEEAVAGGIEDAAVAVPQAEALVASASAALAASARVASQSVEGFREAMRRRFARDRERIEGYFGDLLAELERRAGRGRMNPADVVERRRVLERERVAKLDALPARYAMRLELRPVALLLVEAPVYRITLELRRRKATRTVGVEYDCATRHLVAPVCDGCRAPARRPAACDAAVHLLCEDCAPRSDGRIVCAACSPASRGRPVPLAKACAAR